MPVIVARTPSEPDCWLITQTSQAAAAYIGKASAWRKIAIHGPGFGRRRPRPGKKPRSAKGAARPRPIARKTAKVAAGGAAKPAAIAAPMKGAVQGVATSTARSPVKKLPMDGRRAPRASARVDEAAADLEHA